MENFDEFGIVDGNCENYTIDHFNTAFSNENSKLMVMNFNIQCFDTKIDEFSVFFDQIEVIPDIIVLTETWFAPTTCRTIPGYKDYNCTRKNLNDRGGVTIYVLESLNLKCIHYSFNVSTELEYVHVTLKPNNTNRKNIDVIGIYRPPHDHLINDFFCSMESVVANLEVSNDQILMGDFNICGLKSQPKSNA